MQNREQTEDKKTKDGKHFIHLFVHSFIPTVICLPGANHTALGAGLTLADYVDEAPLSSPISSLVRQRTVRIERKKKSSQVRPEGQG